MFARCLCVLLCLSVVVPALHAASPKDWTVMVFVNADNNLDAFGVKDLAEMEKVGSTDGVDVVVQIDRWSSGAKRYHVGKGGSELIQDLGEVDMGSEKVLVDFATWAKERHPARRYALILWNHGSGWQKKDGTVRGISYDDSSGNHISTPELGTACRDIAAAFGHPIDLLGFDACLMNMIEVAYELREHVGIMVGSEETEPGDGWPYDKWLAPLVRRPAMNASELGALICEKYRKSYLLQKATQSALDCSRMSLLREGLDGWAEAVMADGSGEARAALAVASEKVARFAFDDYADLFGMLKIFRGELGAGDLREATDAVLALRDQVVVANETHGFPLPLRGVYGIAIHFPQGSTWWSAYRRLAFAKDGRWDEMLEAMVGKALEGDGPFDGLHRDLR